MKFRGIIIAVTALIFCFHASLGAHAQTTNVTVSGWVVDADSLGGIPGVKVMLLDASKRLASKTTTNQKGVFSFAQVPGGSYYIRTVIPGYRKMISKMFTITPERQKYFYKLAIKKTEEGDLDIDYYEYLDMPEDWELFIDDK